MKNLFIGMLLIVNLSACKSSTEAAGKNAQDLTANNQRTAQLFASVNEKIYGDIQTLFDGNFKNFKMKDYDLHLQQYRSSKAEELKSDLKDFEILNLYSHPKTFIVCIHSSKRNYTICDDPRCARVEKAEAGPASLINDWLTELPVKRCPPTPKINY